MIWESLGACDAYLTATAEIKIHLPKKKPFCQYCEQVRYQQSYDRHYCGLTGDYLMDIKKERGVLCPLKFEKENEQ